MSSYSTFCVFFFQAEDGIRDHCVTGVQTCALPISSVFATGYLGFLNGGPMRNPRYPVAKTDDVACSIFPPARLRSEERRVGKEGRSRWGPDHLKKKKKRLDR